MTSTTSVDINLKSREMVILGTQYAGEMKKGVFRSAEVTEHNAVDSGNSLRLSVSGGKISSL